MVMGNGFEFGQDLADDFHVTLSGDATGLEQTYIDNWKYSFPDMKYQMLKFMKMK